MDIYSDPSSSQADFHISPMFEFTLVSSAWSGHLFSSGTGMCEITRIHYLDCPHIARIVSKFCKPYLNGPQDRSCAKLNNTDAEVRPSHCKRSGCKPKVTMLWVEAGTFVTDDNFPIIQSLQQLKIAIRKRPVEERTEK